MGIDEHGDATRAQEPSRGAGRSERLQLLAEAVLEAGSLPVDEIVQRFAVSTMTAYRDVAELERQGVVVRSKGIVVAAASSLNETTARFRLTQHTDAKASIARAAGELVRPGMSLLLDDSSSALALLRVVADRVPLTVATHSQVTAREVEAHPAVELFVAGGQYRRATESFYGPATTSAIRLLHADATFMSVTAIRGATAYHPYEEVAEVKRAMLDAAELRVLLADHSKFGRHALHVIGDVSRFDVVVVDAATDEVHLRPFHDAGVRVVVAP
ncbi:DeoR/GlpR family DNA-binding transcription regulator [Agrococcus versicolor]|uniref:DeoR/GlpR family DNA-binding transcription regulator n=1 Tax=Agrococcus versicolor TaxID=501482 RepID=A0ABP5MHE7_9MICO